MPGPWEKYGVAPETQAAEAVGPWSKFSDQPTTAAQPAAPAPAAKPQPSKLESTLRGVAQGATFGFADELAGVAELIAGGSYAQGRDESRAAFAAAEKANPRTYLGGEVGGGILSTFVPGLGWLNAGKTAVAGLATGAAAGAATGLGRSTADTVTGQALDVAKGAAVGGVLGGAIGGVLQAVSRSKLNDVGKRILMDGELESVAAGRPSSPTNRAAIEEFLNTGDNSLRIQDRANKIFEALPEDQLKFPVDQARWPADYVNYTMHRPAGAKVTREVRGKFRDALATMTPADKDVHWRGYQGHLARGQAVVETVEKLAQQALPGVKDPLGVGWFKYIQDPMFTGRQVDNAVGSNFEGLVGATAQAGRQMTLQAAPFVARIKTLRDASIKAFGKDLKKVGRYLDDSAVAAGELGKLNPAQTEVVAGWRKWFEDVRQGLRERGVDVGKLEGEYFPQQEMAPEKMYRSLKNRVEELKKTQGGYRPGLDEDLDRALTNLNKGQEPRSTAQVDRLIEDALSPAVRKERLGSEASAAFRREGVVPDLVREFDVGEAATRYLMGNLKAAHFRPIYNQLHSNIAMLRGLGLEKSADYFQKYFSRVSGEPSGFYAYMQYAGNKWKAHWDDVLQREDLGFAQRKMGELAKTVPDLLSWSSSVIYPNLLGWNIYAPIRNMSQTWATTAPELGGGWGMRATARGWLRASKSWRSENASKFLKDRGLLGETFEGEAAERAIASGLNKVPGLAQVVGGIEKLGQLGMTLYTASDTANRYLTYHIGQEVAKDLLAGTAGAAGKKFLQTLPAGMKADIRAALRAGHEEQLGDMLGKYLIRKTQFDYGKANLNQFGQDFGRLASMFMKWPSVILSDVHELSRTRRGFEKIGAPLARYGTPLALLAAGQQFLDETGASKSPMTQLALGRSLVNWAPASAVFGLERPPPLIAAVGAGFGAAKSAVDGELREAGDKIRRAFEPFVPALGAVNATKRRFAQAFKGE